MLSRTTQSLSELFSQTLGNAIAHETYKITEVFPSEVKLALKYGVGKPAVRAATIILSTKGLLKSSPRQRAKIQTESSWNLYDTDVLKWLLCRQKSTITLHTLAEILSSFLRKAEDLVLQNVNVSDIAAMEKALTRMRPTAQGLNDSLEAEIVFNRSMLVAIKNLCYPSKNKGMLHFNYRMKSFVR